jgi:hypothetical protein
MVRGSLKLGCYAKRTQRPDAQSLYALSGQDGRLLKLEDGTTYKDDGSTMVSILETADLGGDSPNRKGLAGYTVGIYTTESDTVTMGYEVDQGVTRGEQMQEVFSEGSTFDSGQWDVAVFGGAGYQRIADVWMDRPDGAAVRLTVTHESDKPVAIKELSALVTPFGRLAGDIGPAGASAPTTPIAPVIPVVPGSETTTSNYYSGEVPLAEGGVTATVTDAALVGDYVPNIIPNWNTTLYLSALTDGTFTVNFNTPAPAGGVMRWSVTL